MPSAEKLAKKEKYANKLINLCLTQPLILMIGVDNIGSQIIHTIRIALRGKATLLFGKNTQIRRALRVHAEQNGPGVTSALLPHIQLNIGLVFTDAANLAEVRSVLEEKQVTTNAKPGMIAPSAVTIPSGPTGLDPAQTNFFQVLNIATKITKGQIELLADVQIIKANEKVTSSAAALLDKLKMKPFMYKVVIKKVCQEGCVCDASILDMTKDTILAKFATTLSTLASFSFAANLPTVASVPHMVMGTFKETLAVALAAEFDFKQVQQFHDAKANAPAGGAASSGGAVAAAAPAAKAEEAPAAAAVVEEEEEEMEFDLFD